MSGIGIDTEISNNSLNIENKMIHQDQSEFSQAMEGWPNFLKKIDVIQHHGRIKGNITILSQKNSLIIFNIFSK